MDDIYGALIDMKRPWLEVNNLMRDWGFETGNVTRALDYLLGQGHDVMAFLEGQTQAVKGLDAAYEDLNGAIKKAKKLPEGAPSLFGEMASVGGLPPAAGQTPEWLKNTLAHQIAALAQQKAYAPRGFSTIEKFTRNIAELSGYAQKQGINITFNEPVFMEREDSMDKIANKIYNKIKQEQRLSFGSAYSG